MARMSKEAPCHSPNHVAGSPCPTCVGEAVKAITYASRLHTRATQILVTASSCQKRHHKPGTAEKKNEDLDLFDYSVLDTNQIPEIGSGDNKYALAAAAVQEAARNDPFWGFCIPESGVQLDSTIQQVSPTVSTTLQDLQDQCNNDIFDCYSDNAIDINLHETVEESQDVEANLDVLARAVTDNQLIEYMQNLTSEDLQSIMEDKINVEDIEVNESGGSNTDGHDQTEVVTVDVNFDKNGVIYSSEEEAIVEKQEVRRSKRVQEKSSSSSSSSSSDPVTIKIRKSHKRKHSGDEDETYVLSEDSLPVKKSKSVKGTTSESNVQDGIDQSVAYESSWQWKPSNRAAKPVLSRLESPPLQFVAEIKKDDVKCEIATSEDEEDDDDDAVVCDRPWEPAEIECVEHIVNGGGRHIGDDVVLPGLNPALPAPQYVGDLYNNPHFIVGVTPTTEMMVSLTPIPLPT